MENSPDAPQQKADSDRHRQRDGSAPRCFREDGGQYRAHRQFGHDLRIPAWHHRPRRGCSIPAAIARWRRDSRIVVQAPRAIFVTNTWLLH